MHSIAKLLTKFVAALVCSLVLWEVILECAVVRSPGTQTHPDLGRLVSPGLLVHGTEGFSVTHINSLGMRCREIQTKSSGSFRVLMLGDSFTEGYQVADGRTFCDRVQAALQRKYGSNVEVLNGGRSGGSPAYYLHLAKFYRDRVAPEFVVVQLDEGDFTQDLLNANKPFAVVADRQTFKTVQNTSFISENPFTQRFPKLSFLTSVSTLRVASERMAALRGRAAPDREGGGETAGLSAEGRRAMAWTISELHQRYPRLLLVYLPAISYDRSTTQPSEVETMLAQEAEKNGVPLINMREDFIANTRTTFQPPCGFNNSEPGVGHINDLGHALTAARISDYLSSQIPQ